MDIFMIIVLCVVFSILFSICGWCCKRKREGTVYGYGPNVTVATQHVQSSSVVVPPYPVETRHPTPQTGGPPPGFAVHTPPYPTHAPHPQPAPIYYPPPPIGMAYQPVGGPTPYPPPGGAPYPPAGGAPYPPAGGAPPYPTGSGAGDYNSHPPPYDVAVNSPPVQPLPLKEGYGKQSPYNPNFS